MEHAEAVAAIIGAACIIARAVVFVTPTPKDDEIAKMWIGKVLLLASKVFGLDVHQGLKKHGPE